MYGSVTGFFRALAIKACMILVAKFDASICVSPVYAEIFLNSYVSTNGVAKKKLELISELQSQTFEDRPLMACYVGRLSLDKGIPDLLKAWKKVVTKSDVKQKLMLVGSDEIGVDKYIRSYNLTSSVEYMGIVDEQEKFRILSQCRVYITASKNEGWGLTISEALLCGTPVVCYNTATLRRQWKDCPYVFLADYPEDFVDKIFNLINSKQQTNCRTIKEWAIRRLKTFEQIAQEELKIVI